MLAVVNATVDEQLDIWYKLRTLSPTAVDLIHHFAASVSAVP